MKRALFIAAASAGSIVACSSPPPPEPTPSPAPVATKPAKPTRPKLYSKMVSLVSTLDLGTAAPSIVFDKTKAKITDAGTNRKPAIFRYNDATGVLTEKNTDIPGEVSSLIPATADTQKNVRISLTPMWFQPSRDRFFHAGDWGNAKGAGKEYATLTVGFSQRAALPQLNNQQLSWANAWSFITNLTQDVPTAILAGDTDSANTFQRMPIVDGPGNDRDRVHYRNEQQQFPTHGKFDLLTRHGRRRIDG